MDTIDKIKELGIQGFFIVTENGLPVLDRMYSEIANGRVEKLTSMMSTVVKFNHQLVQDGLLTDIGLQTSRIYFDFIKELIFILVVEEKTVLEYKLFNIQTLLKGTISNVKSLFQVKFGEIDDANLLDIFMLQDIFGDDILLRIDEMLLSSYTQLKESFILWVRYKMTMKFDLGKDPELLEIEREFNELQLDIQSNTNSILLKPKEMKIKIDSYLKILKNISNKLDFLKKTSSNGEMFKEIGNLEKEIAILQNQIELDVKMLKAD